MKLHHLKPPPGARTRKRRVGRGDAGRRGAKVGRGIGGTHAHGRGKLPVGFEGGQMPLIRRQPKLPGFQKASRARRGAVTYSVVNVGVLEEAFEDGDEVTVETLRERGLVRKKARAVKVLGDGELTKALTVNVEQMSATAHDKITAAGGSVA